jgi:hypothetical protein
VDAGRRARWLAAAAVAVLAMVGIGLLVRTSDTGTEDTATMAGGEAEESDDSGAAEDSGAAAGTTEAPAAEEAGAIVDLGAVATEEVLADRAGAALGDEGAAEDGSSAEALAEAETRRDAALGEEAGCGAGGDPDVVTSRGGSVVLRGRAVLGGEPVEVWVIDDAGDQSLVALDGACTVVVDRGLGD